MAAVNLKPLDGSAQDESEAANDERAEAANDEQAE